MRLLLTRTRPLADPRTLDRALRAVSPERRRLALRHAALPERQGSLAAALLLAQALRHAGLAPQDTVMRRQPGGKPFFPALPDVHCSLAHGRDCAACVLGTVPCGLDLEPVELLPEGLPGAALHPAELAHWAALPAAAQPRAFARLWTRKEAFLKLLGLGLSLNPTHLAIPPGQPRLHWQGTVYAFQDYTLHGHALCLCLPEGTAFPPLEELPIEALL